MSEKEHEQLATNLSRNLADLVEELTRYKLLEYALELKLFFSKDKSVIPLARMVLARSLCTVNQEFATKIKYGDKKPLTAERLVEIVAEHVKNEVPLFNNTEAGDYEKILEEVSRILREEARGSCEETRSNTNSSREKNVN